jgi:phage antirepressor YoqD-like protein
MATTNFSTFSQMVDRKMFQVKALPGETTVLLEDYFKAVKERHDGGDAYPYDIDEMVPTVFVSKHKAVEALLRDFTQDIDFTVFTRPGENAGRPANDYRLTPLTFEFMVARKSKPIFEIYHRIFHVATSPRDLTREQILLMALESERERMRLAKELEAAQPMIQFHEEVMAGEGEFSIPQTCKILFDGAVTANQLREWLKNQSWMDRRKGLNEPTVWAIRQGYMRLKLNMKVAPGKVSDVPVITAKGLTLLRHLYRTGELFVATIPVARRLAAPELRV